MEQHLNAGELSGGLTEAEIGHGPCGGAEGRAVGAHDRWARPVVEPALMTANREGEPPGLEERVAVLAAPQTAKPVGVRASPTPSLSSTRRVGAVMA